MSASYTLFVEAKIDNEWHCINGKTPRFKTALENDSEIEYRLSDTYWNGSRSYFGSTYDKLCEIGFAGRFNELSPELKKLYSKYLEDEADGDPIAEYYRPVFIDYDTLCGFVKDNEFDSHGLVHKDTLFRYKNGDIDEIYAVEHEDFSSLTPEERQAYKYYEWDSPYEWNWGLKEVKRRATYDINKFNSDNCFYYEKIEYRIVMIGG